MSLKQKTISNIKWSFIESISLKAISFVLGIVLARLLLPKDFGLLAVVNVFYLLVTLFIDGGLKEALIQKKNATDVDYSTVFWLNLIISVIIYLIFFLASPYIEEYFGYENLGFLIRLQLLVLFFEAASIVQIVKATKELQLKNITKARIPASILSFFVGITMAYLGYGILSLIVQQLVNSFIYTLILIYNIRYKPKWIFDFGNAKSLWSFGYKMVLISLLSRFYAQGVSLIFAKYYSISNLGLYTKARSFQNTPIEIITTTYNKGIYPTLIKLQSNVRGMRIVFLGNIHRLTYIMVLVNAIVFYNSYEIIFILFGKNWIGMTVFLQISALGSLAQPTSNQTISILKAKGKPKIVLNIELISKAISLILIFVLISYYDLYVVFATLTGIFFFSSLIYFFICSHELKFSARKEGLKLLGMALIHFLLGALINLFLNEFIENEYLKLIFFSFLFGVMVLVLSHFNKTYKLRRLFK